MQPVRYLTIAALLTLGITAQALPRLIVQDPATASKDSAHPKSEVDRILDDANKRGEHIYASCLENCEEKSQKTADGVERPEPIELPKPKYPAIAAAAHVSGSVEVKVILDTDGRVIAAHAISGHPLLQAASVNAARGARFTPATLNGSPVKVVGVIVYNFVAG